MKPLFESRTKVVRRITKTIGAKTRYPKGYYQNSFKMSEECQRNLARRNAQHFSFGHLLV